MAVESFWAIAQCVPKMEHIVRRDIEKAGHGAFLPTCARFWSVDGKEFSKERPMFVGYVFFLTNGEDWAGIRDIHGVYAVPAGPAFGKEDSWTPMRVRPSEMQRVMIDHASGAHNETLEPRYTKYYRGKPKTKRKEHRRRRPRPGRRLRNITGQQSPHLLKPQEFVSIGGQR